MRRQNDLLRRLLAEPEVVGSGGDVMDFTEFGGEVGEQQQQPTPNDGGNGGGQNQLWAYNSSPSMLLRRTASMSGSKRSLNDLMGFSDSGNRSVRMQSTPEGVMRDAGAFNLGTEGVDDGMGRSLTCTAAGSSGVSSGGYAADASTMSASAGVSQGGGAGVNAEWDFGGLQGSSLKDEEGRFNQLTGLEGLMFDTNNLGKSGGVSAGGRGGGASSGGLKNSFRSEPSINVSTSLSKRSRNLRIARPTGADFVSLMGLQRPKGKTEAKMTQKKLSDDTVYPLAAVTEEQQNLEYSTSNLFGSGDAGALGNSSDFLRMIQVDASLVPGPGGTTPKASRERDGAAAGMNATPNSIQCQMADVAAENGATDTEAAPCVSLEENGFRDIIDFDLDASGGLDGALLPISMDSGEETSIKPAPQAQLPRGQSEFSDLEDFNFEDEDDENGDFGGPSRMKKIEEIPKENGNQSQLSRCEIHTKSLQALDGLDFDLEPTPLTDEQERDLEVERGRKMSVNLGDTTDASASQEQQQLLEGDANSDVPQEGQDVQGASVPSSDDDAEHPEKTSLLEETRQQIMTVATGGVVTATPFLLGAAAGRDAGTAAAAVLAAGAHVVNPFVGAVTTSHGGFSGSAQGLAAALPRDGNWMAEAILHLHRLASNAPDREGMHPIHLACLYCPNDKRLVGTLLIDNPDAARVMVEVRFSQRCSLEADLKDMLLSMPQF